jgi:hypothetical protein
MAVMRAAPGAGEDCRQLNRRRLSRPLQGQFQDRVVPRTDIHPQETPEPKVKKLLIAGVLSLGLFSSCLGPNRLWNKLHDWNMSATDQRWANEGIFVVFTVIPVYGLCYLADIIVLNSVEWWGGKPMVGGDEEKKKM